MKFLSQIGPWRRALSLLCLSGGLLFLQPCRAGSVGFENTGSMTSARAYHMATLLPDGKVLVTGGYDGTNNPSTWSFATAELYDPAAGTWTATGSMADRRESHTATLLSNGKVLVAGGKRFVYDLAGAELYDPASGTWTPTGSMNVKRSSHTAALLPNGKVLVVGGSQEFNGTIYSLAQAELYDPATGTWSLTGSLAEDRYGHTTTLLSSGKVLVAGGYRRGYNTLASAELFDPATGTWTPTGHLVTARSDHTATLLPDGKVLVAAGINGANKAELYDPASGTWTATADLTTARANHTAQLLPTGKVLVAGGFNGNGSLASAEVYDAVNDSWTPVASVNISRAHHTMTLLRDGKVLIAGGYGTNSILASTELYQRLTPSLLNISTRMRVLTDEKVPIAGFIITGTEPKTVIVRGIGPSLSMPGALADPVIEVHGPSGELLATNDNWKDAATSQQIRDSGLAPKNDSESALWGTINPGAYTVILRGKNGGTGIGLVEVYDLGQSEDSTLANISTRGFVDTGDNVMIGGLIVGGGSQSGAAKVVVRTLGPSIPVNGALANPTLELHDENGNVIAFNDDWKTRPDGSSQQAEIEATTVPPSNDLESALVRTLAPGSYTAIVRGQSNTTGIGLVEFYHLP
jgi:N-acetylneuraminic acid mutarotase